MLLLKREQAAKIKFKNSCNKCYCRVTIHHYFLCKSSDGEPLIISDGNTHTHTGDIPLF